MNCHRHNFIHKFRPHEMVTAGISRKWIEEDRTEGLVLSVEGYKPKMYETSILVIGQPINPNFSHLPIYLEWIHPEHQESFVRVDERHDRWGDRPCGEVGEGCTEVVEVIPACGEPHGECHRPQHRERIAVLLRDSNKAFGHALGRWHCRPYGICLRFTNHNTAIFQ